MRQLDLFGFFSETPLEENLSEKNVVITKEAPAPPAGKPEEKPYSLVDLAEEVLNSNSREKNDDYQKTSFFSSKPEAEKIVDNAPISVEVLAENQVMPNKAHIADDDPVPVQEAKMIAEKATENRSEGETQLKIPQQSKGSVVFDDGKITVKIKGIVAPAPVITKIEKEGNNVQKRGRKSFKEIDSELDLIEVPDDETLFQKQYYPISEVAKWFRVNTSLLRFWENEFDVLKPKKNRKGDRLFRPEDVKNIELIYQLLRERKFTIEGAKEFIRTNKKKADAQLQLTNTLKKLKSFLLDLKANLQE